jgi:hypothetical protein
LLIACVKKAPGSGIRIRDGAMVGSGSGIKHPGSATLLGKVYGWNDLEKTTNMKRFKLLLSMSVLVAGEGVRIE